jgi:proteasome alpha subunit
VFTHDMKPLEVEILVAEVGAEPGTDQMYHILYDGSVVDEDRYTVLGGEADAITGRLEEGFSADWGLDEVILRTARALTGDRDPVPTEFEVAVLARTNGRRAFRRIDDEQVAAALAAA